MSYNLYGAWKGGWALNIHTLSSTPNSNGGYDSVRTEIGEALFLLKYRDDYSQVKFLSEELVKFLKTRMVLPYIDAIIPVPASFQRDRQPVNEICETVGKALSIDVVNDLILKTKDTKQLKSIQDLKERQEAIKGAFQVTDNEKFKNKKVLIIDDLYRSGTTLNELTNVLYSQANVNNVYIVTLTKTRSNR